MSLHVKTSSYVLLGLWTFATSKYTVFIEIREDGRWSFEDFSDGINGNFWNYIRN